MGWAVNPTGPSGWLGVIVMVAMWAAVVALAVWMLMRATRTEHQPPTRVPAPPRSVLDERFLSGEIDAQTYARARRILEGVAVSTDDAARRGT